MKYLLCSIILLFTINKVTAQNADTAQIGKQVFEGIRDLDSLKLKQLLPNRNDIEGYFKESSAKESDKLKEMEEDMLHLPGFQNYIWKNAQKVNRKGRKAGIDWATTSFIETVTDTTEHSRDPLRSIDLLIKFSSGDRIFELHTKVMLYKRYFISGDISLKK
jgi:hypothetical protein